MHNATRKPEKETFLGFISLSKAQKPQYKQSPGWGSPAA